jgi:hypothetical protein
VACTCTLTSRQAVRGVSAVKSQMEVYRAKAKEYARLKFLQNRCGRAVDTGNSPKCIGHSRWAKNQSAFDLQK